MARYKSSFSAAYNDMKQEGLDVSCFEAFSKMELHELNLEIEIISIVVLKATPKPEKVYYVPPKPVIPEKTLSKKYYFNPDGSVRLSFDDEWDDK